MEEKELLNEEIQNQRPDYHQELLQIVRSGASPKVLRERIEDYHENDIAEVMEALTKEERMKLYTILAPQRLTEIFEYMEDMKPYFEELSVRKRVAMISRMDADSAVTLLKSLSKPERSMLIELMDDESQRDIAMIAAFDEDEIGSRMSTNYIEITAGISVKQAMHALVDQAAENDNISTIYVLDDDGIFYGAIDLKDLILAREGSSLEAIIMTSYPYVYANESIDDCLERMKDYSEDSIPVLGNDNKLLGVITSQSIVEVIDEEMGEDYARLAGLTAEEDLNEPIKESIKKRMPWLLVLLGLGMVVSSVVGLFESVVSQLTIVICFQSLILDMAGNVGTQSLAVTIRVLMDENLSGKQKVGLVWKEMRVGLTNGLILGSIAFLTIGGYIFLFKGKPIMFSFAISGCIGAALILAMLISSIAGTGIPMLFKKINVDPAVASGPLITTLNDLVAVVSYYGLTWLFLIQMLHISE